jgi:hypothetical protein
MMLHKTLQNYFKCHKTDTSSSNRWKDISSNLFQSMYRLFHVTCTSLYMIHILNTSTSSVVLIHYDTDSINILILHKSLEYIGREIWKLLSK